MKVLWTRGVTPGGDRGDVSPPKFELGGTEYTLSPQKIINIFVKYFASTKTEQGKLNCCPIKTVSLKFSLNLEENLYKFVRTYRYIVKYLKHLFIIYLIIYLFMKMKD